MLYKFWKAKPNRWPKRANNLPSLFKSALKTASIVLLLYHSGGMAKAAGMADTIIIKQYFDSLTHTQQPRSFDHVNQLNKTATFIKTVFNKYADSVGVQEYSVGRETYKNVICTFGPRHAKRIVVGAHYDACGHAPGADDNASGVVGLLELARLLQGQKLRYRIDLVAYSLEEPPFFESDSMGSYIHAKSLFNQKARVYGMISLEMIGYFKTEKQTQEYPIPAMSSVFGTRGNYIGLIKKMGAGSFARRFCRKFKRAHTIKSVQISAPPSLEGIDFSDHRNYWTMGYSALMITDTSFYRNHNYHQATDTMDTLDFGMMAKVIDGVHMALVGM